VAGVVSRETGEVVLRVVPHAGSSVLTGFEAGATEPGATVYTDEWGGYDRLADVGRGHATVRHTPGDREWARDDDGDGIREVHDNTLEGLWTGLRNFLRPFRGVSKWRLGQYVAVFQWVHNLKTATAAHLRLMLGLTPDAS
jgi:transposase